MNDIRCPNCNKKLAETENKPNIISALCSKTNIMLNIKCNKCKEIITVELK